MKKEGGSNDESSASGSQDMQFESGDGKPKKKIKKRKKRDNKVDLYQGNATEGEMV